jgi:hypothetical protein
LRKTALSIIAHSVAFCSVREVQKAMTAFALFIWFTLAGFLLTLFLALFTRYLWPALLRKSHCAWCWNDFQLMRWYPRRWSSTICLHHDRQLRAQSAARQRTRRAAATRPEVQA